MASILNKFVGNRVVFSNKFVLGLCEKFPKLAFLNDVTNLAPIMKWSLSIVPLSQMISGNKPADKIDLQQTASLFSTGTIWTYYATLIQPQNAGTRALAACNAAMAICHGSNLYRRYQFDKEKENQQQPSS
ncbi:UPF0041 family protein [Cavenderia fasciculata]|uniref:Mitochondrial pyruvate carrier n=1 Tax=Cavenderia fasciculata TaxID=261658 RepID=F4Q466_CACFS|nr:UPF0041 family protein [Cavenderia fasciculata]EGG17768.1 UPF0041 family protein [Cavenderia fasciculata]|eukprot:XP_004356252.1 UPF0041 family protein [Cavenderia fasciculata]